MNENLDTIIETAGTRIEQLLATGAVDEANKASYNLAADLAEAWPGDERVREPRHLLTGLAAAERCLNWRRELNKGPKPFALAHWAHGSHLLSLGRVEEAVAAFGRSVESAVSAAREAGQSENVDAGGTYLVIINSGWLGLAQEVRMRGAGQALFEAACGAFVTAAQRAASVPEREEAEYGLANLRAAARRFLPGGAPQA